MPKNEQKEYIDIPINIEDTPTHLYEKISNYVFPEDHLAIATDFLTRLQTTIKAQDNQQELYSLYFNYFEPINASKFTQIDWPATYTIEESLDEKQFDNRAQTLYNELILRNKFDKLKNHENQDAFLIVVEEAWDAYTQIFETQANRIAFPPAIIWDLLENFLYELNQYRSRLATLPKDKIKTEWFGVPQTKALLAKLAQKIPSNVTRTSSSKELFGFFSLVIHANLQVYLGNYQQALKVISQISLAETLAYSRSFGCLLNLFFIASYAYLLLEQYKQSARLGELFLTFYQKNKKHFSKVNSERMLSRQFDRVAGLLCLSYVFLEERPKGVVMEVFKATLLKDKQKQSKQKLADKYFKIRQSDTSTFERLFKMCAMPLLATDQPDPHQTVTARYAKVQTNTLNTILQHYTQISLTKVAKMLGSTEQQVRRAIQSFNEVHSGTTPWDKTIMGPLLTQTRKLQVQISSEGIVRLDSEQGQQNAGEWQQYKEEVAWLVQKVNSL